MADVTSSCKFKRAGLDVSSPFGWHFIQVTVPSGTLTNSQVDDVLLPDQYPAGTHLLAATIQTTDIIANASTCTADLEIARETISTGAIDQLANLVAGHDLKTLDTTYTTTGTTIANWRDASNGLTAGTHYGRLQVEITPAGAYTQTDLVFVVGALLGRFVEP